MTTPRTARSIPGQCYCHRTENGNCDCIDARVEAAELSALFSLRYKADMRAIKRWQGADAGRELIWPDHADLVVWLLDRSDKPFAHLKLASALRRLYTRGNYLGHRAEDDARAILAELRDQRDAA